MSNDRYTVEAGTTILATLMLEETIIVLLASMDSPHAPMGLSHLECIAKPLNKCQ